MTTSATLLRPAEAVAPIDVDERVPLLFDYTELADGDTFSGTPVFTCEAISGTDEDAADRLNGAPELTALQAVQWITGCLEGVLYLVRCKATMSSGQVLVQAISLRCLRVGAEDAT